MVEIADNDVAVVVERLLSAVSAHVEFLAVCGKVQVSWAQRSYYDIEGSGSAGAMASPRPEERYPPSL